MEPPIGVKESCHELIAPHDASVVIAANSEESPIPKRTSGDRDDERAGQKDDPHRPEDRPAVTLLADHRAERVRQPRADCENEEHLQQVGEGRGVLVRMRGVGVEETAAVGAELFDRFL